jgi:glycosyltransferase involved in cell wall biosynthesis
VPYLLHPHGTLDPYLRRRHPIRKRIYEWLIERHNFRHAAAVLFNSADEMRLAEEWLARLCGRARVPYGAVIPVGVDDIWFAPPDHSVRNWLFNRFPELAGKRLVVFFGRLSFKKGLDVLARAFAELSRTSEDLHLVLAGPDSEGLGNVLREWFRQAQLLEKVTFTGLLDTLQGRALLATAEVFVLPSYSENFGQAVAEAMACGTPVVVSDRVNLHSEISKAKAGLVAPCNAEATAAAIGKLLRNPSQAREMGRRGRQCAMEKFTWAVVGERMLELYSQITAQAAVAQKSTGRAGCEQDLSL